MTHSSVKEFEDKRWKEGDQAPVFRHIQTIDLVSSGQKVLDIGCGDGYLLEALRQKGALVSGIDISEEGARKCRQKGIEVAVADISLEKAPFQDKTFDTVILLDILEHVYDPDPLLEKAIRLSKKHIIISVPNFNSLPARIQVLFGRVPENNHPHKGHIYWFNYRVLMGLLRHRKLKVEDARFNTIWEKKPLVGPVTRMLCRRFPTLFALSFVVMARIDS